MDFSEFTESADHKRIRWHRHHRTEWSDVHNGYQIRFCLVCHKVWSRHA